MKTVKKAIALIVLAVLLAGCLPVYSYAAKNDTVKLTVSSTLFVMQGASSYVNVEAAAPADVSYKLILECDDKSITMDSGKSGVLSGDAKQTFSFTVGRKTESGYKTMVLKAVDPDDASKILGEQNVYVDVVENMNSFSSQNKAAFDVSYSISGSDSLTAGQVNFVKLTLLNRGSIAIRNAKVNIEMPDGMSIQSGPASRNIGTFASGKTVSVDYPILIDAGMYTGSYPITVRLSGEHSGEDLSPAVEAIYIPLTGKEKEAEEEPKDESVPLLIVDSFDYGSTNLLKRDAEFTLKLTFLNTGSKEITKAVINVLDPSGAIVPTGTSVIKFDSIKPGEKANGSVTFRTVKDTDVTSTTLGVDMNYYYEPDHLQQQSSYPISLSIEKKPEEEEEKKNNGVVNPILMVTNYDIGGYYVMAGKDFPLNLTITNTSGKTLRNIKVTVQDSTGALLPSEGSNSFFVNSIAAGGSISRSMPMTVNNDAVAGNSTIAVNMSYEDLDGGTHTSSDTITVPVTQEDRLVIDDILDPGWLMMGEQGYAQIKYYNMGKTTLRNLRVSVSGDFTVDGDSSQYVGNMADGRSDYFSFNFFPNSEGEMHGKAVFTFENSMGKEQTIEKEFVFNIQPAPEWEDPGDMPVEPVKEPMPLWKKIAIGVAVAGAAVAGIALSKRHKKKKAEALELDE